MSRRIPDIDHKPAPPPLAVDEAEAASLLGIGATLLEDERKAGRGPPCVRIGRRLLYPVDRLRQWLNDQAMIENAKSEA